MQSPTKLLMFWNVQPEREKEYLEFVAHEFIQGMERLGLLHLEIWYTVYGECEQILCSGITPSVEQMEHIVQSDEWDLLQDKLGNLVNDFHHKLVSATGGFQI